MKDTEIDRLKGELVTYRKDLSQLSAGNVTDEHRTSLINALRQERDKFKYASHILARENQRLTSSKDLGSRGKSGTTSENLSRQVTEIQEQVLLKATTNTSSASVIEE